MFSSFDILPKSWKRGFEAANAAKDHSDSVKISQRMGAALFSGSKLLSFGWNEFGKTHTKFSNILDEKEGIRYLGCIHAEVMAVLKRRYYNDKNLIMYIYRELDNGKVAFSKPCKTCASVMKEFNVKIVRYIDKNKNFVESELI